MVSTFAQLSILVRKDLRVEQPKPVTDFVGDSLSLVEVGQGATWCGGIENAASIIVEVVRASGYRGWEVAVSQIASDAVHEVDI